MHQQYLLKATSTLNYMSSSELQQLFNDDEKLDEKIDETVRKYQIIQDSLLIFLILRNNNILLFVQPAKTFGTRKG